MGIGVNVAEQQIGKGIAGADDGIARTEGEGALHGTEAALLIFLRDGGVDTEQHGVLAEDLGGVVAQSIGRVGIIPRDVSLTYAKVAK